MATYPIINGKTYDFTSLEASFPLLGIVQELTKIDYSDTLEVGELRGTKPWVLATTKGNYSAEASFGLSKQFYQALLVQLNELSGGLGPYVVEFPLTITYGQAGMPLVRDELIGCRLINPSATNAQGTDPTIKEGSLFVKYIKWNGISPMGDDAPF